MSPEILTCTEPPKDSGAKRKEQSLVSLGLRAQMRVVSMTTLGLMIRMLFRPTHAVLKVCVRRMTEMTLLYR
jgi:hypothetical protein